MSQSTAVEWWQNNAQTIFENKVLEELYVYALFRREEGNQYLFQPYERGDSAWLRPSQSQNGVYEAFKVEEHLKYPSQQLVPVPYEFGHCEPIPLDYLEDGHIQKIKNKLERGAQAFAQRINTATIDVVTCAISKSYAFDSRKNNFNSIIALVSDELSSQGFNVDKLIFSKSFLSRLLTLGLIVKDAAIDSKYYAGTTISGIQAFWSEELPKDKVVVFDSHAGVALSRKSRFTRRDQYQPFTVAACGFIELNPIVVDNRAFIGIDGLEELITKLNNDPAVRVATGEVFVENSRIDELRSIAPTPFDLTKLVRFCEELNSCITEGNFFAIAMLVRAILDHVPPIFGVKNFAEIANNYAGGSKSFKQSMQHLENSSRKIADAHLHVQIRNKEVLPTKTQVNFSSDLDVLLSEIVRILK